MKAAPLKRTIVLVCLLNLIAVPAAADVARGVFHPQTDEERLARRDNDPLIPMCNFPKATCGFVDRAREVVIKPQFDWADRFFDGRAVVSNSGKFGVIDETGKLIVPIHYPLIGPFRNGLAQVLVGDKVGVIDVNGHWVLPATFGGIVHADENAFLVANPPYRVSGRARPGDEGDLRGLSRHKSWGVADGDGNIVIPIERDWLAAYRTGWRPFRKGVEGDRTGRGKNTTPERAAPVSRRPPDTTWGASIDGKPIYLDKSRTTAFGAETACPDGRHLKLTDGEWKIVDGQGVPIPDIRFRTVQLMCKAPSIVGRNGKRGLIARDGTLIGGRYFDSASAFHDGITMVREGGLWSVIDESGRSLLGPLRLAHELSWSNSGQALIELEPGMTRLTKALVEELARDPDALTRPLVPRGRYADGLAAKLEPVAPGSQEGKWGFVDEKGVFVIAPRFDAVGMFRRGVVWAAIPERREWCLIDKRGNVLADTPCRCGQPIVAIGVWSKKPPRTGDCYADGLRDVATFFPIHRGYVR